LPLQLEFKREDPKDTKGKGETTKFPKKCLALKFRLLEPHFAIQYVLDNQLLFSHWFSLWRAARFFRSVQAGWPWCYNFCTCVRFVLELLGARGLVRIRRSFLSSSLTESPDPLQLTTIDRISPWDAVLARRRQQEWSLHPRASQNPPAPIDPQEEVRCVVAVRAW